MTQSQSARAGLCSCVFTQIALFILRDGPDTSIIHRRCSGTDVTGNGVAASTSFLSSVQCPHYRFIGTAQHLTRWPIAMDRAVSTESTFAVSIGLTKRLGLVIIRRSHQINDFATVAAVKLNIGASLQPGMSMTSEVLCMMCSVGSLVHDSTSLFVCSNWINTLM